MIKLGRQISPNLDGIRDDHKERYRFAGKIITDRFVGRHPRVLDMGCGCGYGSFILATEFGFRVYGIDIDSGAILYGEENYHDDRIWRGAYDIELGLPECEAVVAFEIIEHVPDGQRLMKKIADQAGFLVGSVPNEDMIPFDAEIHDRHFRHYTATEMERSIKDAGMAVKFMGGQIGRHKEQAKVSVLSLNSARTLVFVAANA